MIREIKRFVLETAAKAGWRPKMLNAKGDRRNKKVAVVGSGPAGLAAAFDLARAGYAVTVYEAAQETGGMLRYGIPAYRLNDAQLDAEIETIRSLGVRFVCGSELGRDFTIESLKKDGFAAIFLGLGAQDGAKLGIPGEDADGCVTAIHFLSAVNSGRKPAVGSRVAVIGGGFTAVDSARTALRLGAKEVFILYRRTRSEMPATDEEVAEAEEEGVKVMYLVAPREILTKGGRVAGVRMLNYVLGEKDPGGRRRPQEVPGTEFRLAADMVISAVGQSVAAQDVRLTDRGAVEVEEDTLATSVAGVYAGGDCVLGPKNVISAIAQGKRAAVSIDKALSGKDAVLDYDPPVVEADKENVLRRSGAKPREWRVELLKAAPSRRIKGFDGYVPVLTREQAVKEASRCLGCGCGVGCQICHDICKMFAYSITGSGRVELDEKKCVACGMCAHRCPNQVIEILQTSEKGI
jgi:formate dehydrogenase major subunit